MIGKRIKTYLEANGIKQNYLADKVGISTSKMSRICNKDDDLSLGIATYYKICKVLKVPFKTFLEE